MPTISVQEAIADALNRWKSAHPGIEPSQLYLGEFAYGRLHDAAESAGHKFNRRPETEDERMEYKDMKVYARREIAIGFAP